MEPVRRWQPKPSKQEDRGLVTARFTPDEPLMGLLLVAAQADPDAEVTTAMFTSGPVAVVRFMAAAAMIRWVVVRAGFHLAYDRQYRSLREVGDGTLDTWYQEEGAG